MWPVILRELRAGSRRWTTYWLRLLAAGAVMLAVVSWLAFHVYIPNAGSAVFAWSHRVVLAAIWIIVPLMTCDCLSSEKREGTLGLLFLTNLSAREIVLAKAVAHGLRAFTLWLAAVPLVAVPVLLGGLSWLEILLSCGLALGSILFALGLGLLASVCSRRYNGAVALAAFLLPAGFGSFVILFIAVTRAAVDWIDNGQWKHISLMNNFFGFARFLWNAADDWNGITPGGGAQPVLLMSVSILVPAALLVLVVTIFLVAGLLRRNWQDQPKTKRQTKVEKFFCAPVFMIGLFRRWMRHSLERNPIGWLEKRSWTGRITAWIWLAVMISFASALAYTAASRGDFEGYNALMWLLLVSIAYVAAGSFRRERETGALELILVTPLSERQIISGRLRALWSQFLPTFAIWIAVVLYLSTSLKEWQVAALFRFSVSYLIVPIVGLYFSLRSRFVLLSWSATLTACFALPQLISRACHYVFFADLDVGGHPSHAFIEMPVQLALALLLLWRLHVNLRRRSFSLR